MANRQREGSGTPAVGAPAQVVERSEPAGGPSQIGAIPVPFLLAIMHAIEGREPYSRGRARNVALYAVAIARALLLPAETVDAIRIGALLSNIGMIGVPEQLLQKDEALSEEEQQVMRQHPMLGAEILSSVPQLKAVLPMVLHHHEDYAGGGYPTGISGEQIPVGARIIRVVDTYEALTSPRPYRPPYPAAEALEVLAAGSGRQFDPKIVTVFSQRMRRGPVQDEVLERWDELRDTARAWRTLVDTPE